MAYSSDIARLLADQLARFATINRHQLAGQAANLDFWTAEVVHCLGVIDGYGGRFERLRDAQARYVADRRTVEFELDDPWGAEQTVAPPRRVAHGELAGARRHLGEAMYRFLVRCCNDGAIDESELRRRCDRLGLGIEASDLRRS